MRPVALCLIALLLGAASAQITVLPSNATCADIERVQYRCVDYDGACQTEQEAVSAALAGQEVLVCKQDAMCVNNKCARLARIGEPCDSTLGCFDSRYTTQCDTVCRGTNVYGAGEPASFRDAAICDISATSVVRNGGCYEGLTPSSSLICQPTTQTCSSSPTGGPCPNGIECLAKDYCSASGVCTPRSSTTCNFTVPLRFGDECTADSHCRPDNACGGWFGGAANTPCSINEDCDAGLYCNAGRCASVTSNSGACNSPSDLTCAADEVCQCNKGQGACVSIANTATYKAAWLALTKCVADNGCFPVEPGTNGARSALGLSFFEGGCYDTFCRKQWLALTDTDALCKASAAGAFVPSLLLVALIAILALVH